MDSLIPHLDVLGVCDSLDYRYDDSLDRVGEEDGIPNEFILTIFWIFVIQLIFSRRRCGLCVLVETVTSHARFTTSKTRALDIFSLMGRLGYKDPRLFKRSGVATVYISSP